MLTYIAYVLIPIATYTFIKGYIYPSSKILDNQMIKEWEDDLEYLLIKENQEIMNQSKDNNVINSNVINDQEIILYQLKFEDYAFDDRYRDAG